MKTKQITWNSGTPCFSYKKNEENIKIYEENTCDSKTFWTVVKPMLSKKIKSNEKITLTENDEIIKTEKGTAKVFKNFFFKYCPKPRHSEI